MRGVVWLLAVGMCVPGRLTRAQDGGASAPATAAGGVAAAGAQTGTGGTRTPGARVVTAAEAAAALADAQRAALTFTAYDLTVHLQPEQEKLSVLARVSVRNDGTTPLARLPLQISSTMEWEGISARTKGGAAVKLPFDHHRIETDADHTGAANEAIATLPEALAVGASTELTVFYSGTIPQAAVPLERAGAPAEEAALTDWDAIAEGGTSLRGFGDVLWYPVASPQVFLGDGARFAEAKGEQERRGRAALVRLRLEVETRVAQPAMAYFCGRPAALRVVNEGGVRGGEGDTEATPRIATAEFPAEALGFGPLSLFVVNHAPEGEGRTVAVVSGDAEAAAKVETAAEAARGLVTEWLGQLPERQAVLIDHRGDPFAEGALLVQAAEEAASPFAMTHLESHAWFRADQVWLDEGMAQFLPILAIERAHGRGAALAHIMDLQPALSLAESAGPEVRGGGESLVAASRQVIYRNKAVAVLWMLREMVGDDAMKTAFSQLRSEPESQRDATAFQRALEGAAKRDLRWFFYDWVYQDRGLPDLSIESAAPRAVPGTGGRTDGALVAVEVRNSGTAVADVPVTVRSGDLTATERLRIPAKGTAAVRVLFQGTPEEVQVNDGSVPEVGGSVHVRRIGSGG